MSHRRPSVGPTLAQRIALWRAHRRICAYCTRPIDCLSELEIDHIIPQHLLKSPAKLRVLLRRLDMPDLDLNSYTNWLPVHGRPCNRDKTGEVQPDAALHNFLGVARRHQARARKEELRFTKQAENENAVASVAFLIATKRITQSEVLSILNVAGIPHEVAEISWAETALTKFITNFNVTLRDLDDVNRSLNHIRDHPRSTRRAVLDAQLTGLPDNLYISDAGIWRIYFTWSPARICVVHIERKKKDSVALRYWQSEE